MGEVTNNFVYVTLPLRPFIHNITHTHARETTQTHLRTIIQRARVHDEKRSVRMKF